MGWGGNTGFPGALDIISLEPRSQTNTNVRGARERGDKQQPNAGEDAPSSSRALGAPHSPRPGLSGAPRHAVY